MLFPVTIRTPRRISLSSIPPNEPRTSAEPVTLASLIAPLELLAVALPLMPEASISPKVVFNCAPPRISRTKIFPLELSISTGPAASLRLTAPKLFRTTADPPTRFPLILPFDAVQFSFVPMSEKLIEANEVVSSAAPAMPRASTAPLLLWTTKSPLI